LSCVKIPSMTTISGSSTWSKWHSRLTFWNRNGGQVDLHLGQPLFCFGGVNVSSAVRWIKNSERYSIRLSSIVMQIVTFVDPPASCRYPTNQRPASSSTATCGDNRAHRIPASESSRPILSSPVNPTPASTTVRARARVVRIQEHAGQEPEGLLRTPPAHGCEYTALRPGEQCQIQILDTREKRLPGLRDSPKMSINQQLHHSPPISFLQTQAAPTRRIPLNPSPAHGHTSLLLSIRTLPGCSLSDGALSLLLQ